VTAGGFSALVLAGQRPGGDPVASAAGLRWKALTPAGGQPMLQRVLLTLLACPSVGPIAVATPDRGLLDGLAPLRGGLAEGRISLLPTAEGPAASVAAGWESLGHPCPTLVTTADHPLLTPALVEDFCARALTGGGDIAAGLVPATAIRAAFPESRRTYLRFREEAYSGANLFALLTPRAAAAVGFWRGVERDRKRPWRIAQRVGLGALVAYLLRHLTLEGALRRLSAAAGAEGRAVVLQEAWAAVDVDKPDDLALVERILAARESPPSASVATPP